jgi:hypothetical protein
LGEQWSALAGESGVLFWVSFPPFDVQTSFESCNGTAWCGIDGVAYPRILLAVADSVFSLIYSACIMAVCISFLLAL